MLKLTRLSGGGPLRLAVCMIALACPALLPGQAAPSAPSSATTPQAATSPLSAAGSAVSTGGTEASVRDHYRKQEIESSTELELQASLRELGLSDQGNLAELRQRLLAWWHLDGSNATGSPAVTTATTGTSGPDEGRPSTGAPDSGGAAAPQNGPAATPSPDGNKPLDVTIETAGSASYFTVEEVDENYLRLSGGVSIIVNDSAKNTTHRIRAERIMYNRKQDTMIAQGDVVYQLTENGKETRFTGSEMRFALGSMEVFLLDGKLFNQHAVSGNQLNFRIEGEEIGRADRNLSVLENATVTSSKATPASYQVKAGHIWILQSGEWAIRDGVLYVGRVPVMWFPFFYYPSDELFFNPVAGYQDPEGAFLQTTTYLYGHKAKSQAPLSFMQFNDGGGDSTFRSHGLWLERIGKSAASPSTTESNTGATPSDSAASRPSNGSVSGDYLKLLIDAYSRFGILAGFQGKFTAAPVANFDFTGLAGFSRNLYTGASGISTYYIAAGQAESEYWDSGYLFGTVFPFRFLADIQANVKAAGYQLGISIPLASDPSFRTDFLANRKEDINWAKLIGLEKSTTTAGTATGATSTSTTAETMNMSVTNAWNIDMALLRPFVDNLTLNNLDATLNWSAHTWATPVPQVSTAIRTANKRFWAPEILTLPKFGLTVSGTLLQYPWVSPTPPAASGSPAAGQPGGQVASGAGPAPGSAANDPGGAAEKKKIPPFLFPETEIEPEPVDKDKKVDEAKDGATKDGAKPQKPAEQARDPDAYVLADAQGAAQSDFKLSDWDAKLTYSIVPGLTVSSRFSAADSTDPQKISMDQNYWTSQQRFSGNLRLNIFTPLRLVNLDSTLNLTGQDQSILQSDSQAPAAILTNIKQETVKARYLTVDNASVLKYLPLSGVDYVGTSSVEYGLSSILYRYRWVSGLTPETAEYKTETADWTKELITKHYSGLTLAFIADPFSAHLSGQYTLPPLAQTIAAHADIGLFKGVFSADETFTIADAVGTSPADASNPDKIGPGPLKLGLNLPLVDWFSTTHNLEIDVKKEKVTNYTAALNLFGFNATLIAKPAADQVFSQTTHAWVASGTEYFRPVSASLNYTLAIEPDPFWYNRMKTKFGLSGQWTQNFITVSDSTLSWNISWDYRIAEFLDFNFTLSGQNSRLFRYFPEYNRLIGLPASQDKDLLTDLLQSFNFIEESKRQGSYFKMNTMSLKAVHYLGDWQLTVSYTGQPTVQTVNSAQSMIWTYQFSAYVAWVPIPEIKSTIKASKDVQKNIDVLTIE